MSGLLSGYFANLKYSNKLASCIKLERVNTKIWINCVHKAFLSELVSHGNYIFSLVTVKIHSNNVYSCRKEIPAI